MDGSGLAKNLTSFDVLSLNTTEKCADVVACFSVIKGLSEHFDTGNNSLCSLFGKTDDLNFVAELELSSFYSTGCNGTTSGDGHSVLNRHKEGKVSLTVRSGDIRVNIVHKLKDRSICGIRRIGRGALKCSQSGALDDRDIVAGELVLGKDISDVHFNELEKLRVVNLVNLVHENNDCRNANLTGKKDMLSGLSHRSIRCSNYEDSAVHLSSTGDHVLNVVGVAGAVNVSIVTMISLILNVSGVDGDTTLSLLRSLIDHIVSLELSLTLKSQNLGDSCGKSGLAMVNVTDGTNINVGLGSFKFLLCHWNCPPLNLDLILFYQILIQNASPKLTFYYNFMRFCRVNPTNHA